MAQLLLDVLNLAALLLIAAGFFLKDRRCHILRAFGWVLFAVYWFSKVPGYANANDWVNGAGAFLALPIFSFLAYHEYMSYQWNDEYPPLRFVAGALFVAGMGYFVINHVPAIRELLIGVVAHESVWLANLFGHDFGISSITSEGAYLTGVPIVIVLECTAIQAFFVAGAFLFGCRGDKRKKALAFFVMAPVIWFVNLARNAIVMILTYDRGPGYFEFAHNYIGKTLSLVTLIILIIFGFWLVPELYEDINGLFELPWRKGPGHDYKQFVGRLYREKDSETGKE